MAKLSWLLASSFHRIGLLRLAGIGLMLAALGLLLQAKNNEDATLDAENQLQRLPKATDVKSQAHQDTLSLPQGDAHALNVAAGLQKLVEEQGLFVERTDYRFEKSAKHNVYQINLPLKGDYPHLRAFLDKALSSYPSLALQGLHLSREDIQSRNIDAELRFTLYLR